MTANSNGSPCFYACMQVSSSQNSAPPHAPRKNRFYRHAPRKNTFYRHASRTKTQRLAAWLIESGADANQMDASGQTALHMAMECDNFSLVSTLVRKGGDVNLKRRCDGRSVVSRTLGIWSTPCLSLSPQIKFGPGRTFATFRTILVMLKHAMASPVRIHDTFAR